MTFTQTILAAGISLLALSGCSDNPTTILSQQQNDSTLRVIDNSDEFYAALREGLIRTAGDSYYGREFLSVDDLNFTTAEGGTTGGTTGGETTGGATGGQVADSESVGASQTGGTDNVTGTNVQEIGVDEQDRVKADSSYLYVLNNEFSNFGIEEGGTTGGTAVLRSTFYYPQASQTKLRILSFQPEAPDATAVADITLDLQGRTADGMYLHSASNGQNAIVTSSGYNNYWAAWDQPYAFANQVSGIARVDVSDPTNANIAEQFEIDGTIISSRRIGSRLIVASRFFPSIEGVDPYSVTTEEYEQAVNSADLSTLLPTYSKVGSDEKTAMVDPASCFVAPKVSEENYYVPNIITLSIIDLNSMQLADSTCFLGSSETLYASPNAIYLATTRWDYQGQITIDTDDGTVPSVDYIDPRVNTDFHEFLISGNQLNYNGSGAVKGHLGWNQLRKPFRMSEKDGYLRVATYSDQFSESISPINMTVLKSNGRGQLETISQLPNDSRPAHIGKPGEQLYASRYVGDKAYIVTFRQTDPLYVIDLANPADPYLAGELEIEGYSDYLQPISENYLLGIGKDAVVADDGWGDGRGGLVQGIKLALFDVSDASVPTEVQSLIIGQRGSHANALSDHRAITVQRATDQHPTRVAFNISVAGETLPSVRPTSSEASNYYQQRYSGLHGFEVRTGADAGIELTGVLTPAGDDNAYWYGNQDRSVIYNDSVYYIRDEKVYAAPWGQMDNAVGPR